MKKRALVTGGGGPAGISWETGIIVGLSEAGVNVRDADLFLGTSGGSCVAAKMTSDLTLDELFQRQVDPALQATELPAQPDFERMEADFARILKDKILTTIFSCAKIHEYEYKFNFMAHSEVCMATIAPLGAFQEVSLSQGTVRYSDQGTGPTLVFLHGLLANRLLWGRVIPRLVSHFRCIAPDLPLGAHSHPLHPDADLSPLGVAHLVADFLEALDLHEVTLIGNDTGGAICQLVIAHHPERINRLVLTNCDAFEQFFPPLVNPFQYGARIFGIGFANFLAWMLRARSAQRLFVAALAHRRPELEELEAFFHPLLHLPGARRDMTRFLQAVSNRYTLEAAGCFSGFQHPVLLLWGKDDPFFSGRLARRLQHAFPDARLQFLSHCRAFVPVDQPEVFAQQMTEFVHAEVLA